LQRISDNASTLSRNYEEELRRVLAPVFFTFADIKIKQKKKKKRCEEKKIII
jgi:hypothetical protein